MNSSVSEKVMLMLEHQKQLRGYVKIRHRGFGVVLGVKRENEDKKRGNGFRHGYRLSSNWSVRNIIFTSKRERDVRSTFLD